MNASGNFAATITIVSRMPVFRMAKSAFTLRRKSIPDLNSRLGSKLVYGGDGYLIAELTKGSRQHLGTLFLFPGTHFAALLDISHPFMQDLPNYATEPMGNGPDGGLIAEAGH